MNAQATRKTMNSIKNIISVHDLLLFGPWNSGSYFKGAPKKKDLFIIQAQINSKNCSKTKILNINI